MAKFLTAGDWVTADTVGAYLRNALPDSYVVVADPVVCRYQIDAVVVGPNGLSILQTCHGSDLTAEERRRRGVTAQECERLSLRAVRAFMDDEFPKLPPAIHHYDVVRDTSADMPLWRAVREGQTVRDETLAESISAAEGDALPVWASETLREDVAVALRDRRLTATMRATKPFVFRSGSAFHVGSKAWTIKAAVAHMDRYPEDGVYHLRNGTLATWLNEEGATHLGKLARDVAAETKTDWRASLESFLIETGLVERPKLRFRPRVVDLGYVLHGESAARVLRLRRGAGRGYLSGELETTEPWLFTEPRGFAGSSSEIVVSANTDLLSIHPEPHQADVVVESSASEQPISIPVRVRVVAMPAPLVRRVLRPATAAAIAGVIGALIGLAFQATGVPLPALFADWQPFGLSAWVVLIAALWALFGVIPGLLQPPAWPTRYAVGRWMEQVLAWTGALVLAGVGLVWAWRLGRGGAPLVYSGVYPITALIGLAIAVVPASLGEAARSRKDRRHDGGEGSHQGAPHGEPSGVDHRRVPDGDADPAVRHANGDAVGRARDLHLSRRSAPSRDGSAGCGCRSRRRCVILTIL